ncbi:hypothetical protein [Streptomyces sp. YKOK-I1]
MDGRLAVPSARIRDIGRTRVPGTPATASPLPTPTRDPPLRLAVIALKAIPPPGPDPPAPAVSRAGITATVDFTIGAVVSTVAAIGLTAGMDLTIDPPTPAPAPDIAVPATVAKDLMADMADMAAPALASTLDLTADPLTPAPAAMGPTPDTAVPATVAIGLMAGMAGMTGIGVAARIAAVQPSVGVVAPAVRQLAGVAGRAAAPCVVGVIGTGRGPHGRGMIAGPGGTVLRGERRLGIRA